MTVHIHLEHLDSFFLPIASKPLTSLDPKFWSSLRRPFLALVAWMRLSRGSRSSSLLCRICFRGAFNLEVILTNRGIPRLQQCHDSYLQNHMKILWQLIQQRYRLTAVGRASLLYSTTLEGEKSDENASEKSSTRVLVQVAKRLIISKLLGRIYLRPPTASPCYIDILCLADSPLRAKNRLLAV